MTEQPLAHDDRARFVALLERLEPSLRRALVAAYGAEAGREAAADAIAWAWEHRSRLEGMSNPGGYLWRVGQTAARRARGWSARRANVELPDLPGSEDAPPHEPSLATALATLTPQQRAAVLLVHGWGHTLGAAAATLGCSISTVRNHLQRGLTKLQAAMGAGDA